MCGLPCRAFTGTDVAFDSTITTADSMVSNKTKHCILYVKKYLQRTLPEKTQIPPQKLTQPHKKKPVRSLIKHKLYGVCSL